MIVIITTPLRLVATYAIAFAAGAAVMQFRKRSGGADAKH